MSDRRRCGDIGRRASGAVRVPRRGPVYQDGEHGEPELLASCYRTCLELAEQNGVETISFPAISTGVYGYPVEEAAAIAVKTISEHLAGKSGVREAMLVLFDQRAYDTYARVAACIGR